MTPAALQREIDAGRTIWEQVEAMLRAHFRLTPEQIAAWRASDRDLVELMTEWIEGKVRAEINSSQA